MADKNVDGRTADNSSAHISSEGFCDRFLLSGDRSQSGLRLVRNRKSIGCILRELSFYSSSHFERLLCGAVCGEFNL